MMDGPNSSLAHPSRDRPHPRASSRSSISTTSTRITSQSSANSSLSSPRLGHSGNLPHRPYTTTGTKSSTHLMREGSMEARGSPMSSFLQEKLQRERRADMDTKSVRSMKISADQRYAPETRGTQSSPIRQDNYDGRRSPSNGSGESRKKGMGVKEMEQTVSTLHKQNFDLKLELYHRRERQTVLEDRLEGLTTEKDQMEEMNDTLLEELEKRDKAVEEAVAMIVLLESQVETLLKEREMVRQIEVQTAFHHLQNDETDGGARASTPRVTGQERRGDAVEAMRRMPSFLSEQSETTENLRNVYLNVHGSLQSLRRPAGDMVSEVDKDRANSLASPSLSVLSESSFVSVYGRAARGQESTRGQGNRRGQDITRNHKSTMGQERDTTDGNPSLNDYALSELGQSGRRTVRPAQSREQFPPPAQQGRTNSITRAMTPGHFQSLASMVDRNSPLQKLEQLERTMSMKTSSSRQSGKETVAEADQQQRDAAAAQRRTKEQKREALRRVMTDAPGARTRDRALPPTPDTISSTTLRRYKNSDDELSRQQSFLAMSDVTSPSLNLPPLEPSLTRPDNAKPRKAELGGVLLPPMTAFSSRRDAPGANLFDGRHSIIARPRSAGETTASRNEWDSESDDESDARSVGSSVDMWMREGWKAKRASGQASPPDLFGFPPSMAASWAPGAAAGGSYPYPKPAKESRSDLISVQAGLLPSGGPPPPPNRRSSLHAPTGSTSASAQVPAETPVETEDSGGRWRRKGSMLGRVRRNSDVTPDAVLGAQEGGGTGTGHYPPTSQQNRPRGLKGLFRRSLGAESVPSSATESTFAAAAASGSGSTSAGASTATKPNGIGIPSWVRSAEDDRGDASATPPPIMRSRVTSGSVGQGQGSFDGEDAGGAPVGAAGGNANGEAGRRKWLAGFGRTNSLKTRG